MQGPFDAFVGCSSPRHFGVLDAHENVGFLILDEDLRVVCENTTLRLPRSQIVEVRLRPNVHSWLGLGRWVSVEGEGIRLYLEPRNARTLLANRRASGPLLERIRRWRAA